MKIATTVGIGIAVLEGLLALCWGLPARAEPQAGAKAGPVSYHKQIWPILQAHCQGCHQPASPGGHLAVTTYALFQKGGESGPAFQPGKPEASSVMAHLTGKASLMPKGGPPLADAEIALFRRWIAEGAQDDTPIEKDPIDADHPPVYTTPPVIAALAFSPDGKTLAVSGYREVLLHHADGSGLIARLVGKSHILESLAYSPDGRLLAAAGGAPARFGEVQFWDTATNKLVNAVQIGYDTLFGASFAPDGKELAFGGADNSARVISVPDGKPLLKFDNHSDWVFATAFSMDSKDLLTASRDQAVKLTVVDSGSFIDDLNTHASALRSLARNPAPAAAFTQTGPRRFHLAFSRDLRRDFEGAPASVHIKGDGATDKGEIAFPLKAAAIDITLPDGVKDGMYAVTVAPDKAPPGQEADPPRLFLGSLTVADAGKTLRLQADEVLCGGADGIPRLYQVFRTEARTMNMEDHNLIRAFPRQTDPITALAFSPDGAQVAVATEGPKVNLYRLADGKLLTSLSGHQGAIYAVAFRPDGAQLATGGFDGRVRLYALPSGRLLKTFIPVPLRKRVPEHTASRPE
ncbi:MAG TPA: c-type cytochrome domain-containing protein [Chthonomonadaceae bacterium]|nr:c-type cytochrome domain-containing protein [Chthonomonadaceae bacterium]